jgi:beta-N-acetylhexosaminidase
MPRARTLFTILSAVLGAALLLPPGAGAAPRKAKTWADRAPDEARVERMLQSLTVREKVGQLILAYPQINRSGPVEVGGVLFVGNTLRKLDAAKERIASTNQRAKVAPFHAVDIEGGSFNRLKTMAQVRELPLAIDLAKLEDREVEAWGHRVGGAMRSVGLNMNLAPVFDVAGKGHMARTGRSFSGDAGIVRRKGTAFSRGLVRSGVVPIGKHFPGYGDLDADSDHVRAVADWSPARIEQEAAVFDAAAGLLGGVMLSNIIYSQVGPRPAILEPKLVAMAHQRGWITVTDDIAIRALAEEIGAGSDEVLRQAFLAGNDLLLTTAPPDWDKGLDYFGILVALVESDPAHLATLDAACRRVLRLKDRMGLLDGVQVAGVTPPAP